MKRLLYFFIFCLFIVLGCNETNSSTSIKDDGIITFKLIQLNDVYEIAPLSGGKYGGMARVAHISDSIKAENPNTLMFMAGDFLNPSLLGAINNEGERISGKQMIEVMNAMQFDLVTFGNHEFDIGEAALQKRLNESTFSWASANVRQIKDGEIAPFKIENESGSDPVRDVYNKSITDADGTTIRLGFFSVTINSNPRDFVSYGDIFSEAKRAYTSLQSSSDIIIGLTHTTIEDDKKLAEALPGVPLIMGGHEHNNMLVLVNNTVISKADANAKSIYIHTVTYNKNTQEIRLESKLFPVDEKIPSQAKVEAIVEKWNQILVTNIEAVIANPNEVIYYASPPLDGTDSANRGIQTNLGDIITEAMANSFNENVDGALVNGGSIRVDDMLAGDITSLDIFRVLPFGGPVVYAEIKGSLLLQVLDFGKEKGGTGAYLQRYNLEESPSGGWWIGGMPIELSKVYRIAFSDYLLKGYDIPFLHPDNKEVIKIYTPLTIEAASDIRKAVILYLKSLKE